MPQDETTAVNHDIVWVIGRNELTRYDDEVIQVAGVFTDEAGALAAAKQFAGPGEKRDCLVFEVPLNMLGSLTHYWASFLTQPAGAALTDAAHHG